MKNNQIKKIERFGYISPLLWLICIFIVQIIPEIYFKHFILFSIFMLFPLLISILIRLSDNYGFKICSLSIKN